jgi:hypothetical protein
LQQEARLAALNGDWALVERLLRRIRQTAGNNAWVAGVLDEIEMLAQQRDSARFAKEAMYAANSMGTRLSIRAERAGLQDDGERASYLERKIRHGQGRKRD